MKKSSRKDLALVSNVTAGYFRFPAQTAGGRRSSDLMGHLARKQNSLFYLYLYKKKCCQEVKAFLARTKIWSLKENLLAIWRVYFYMRLRRRSRYAR